MPDKVTWGRRPEPPDEDPPTDGPLSPEYWPACGIFTHPETDEPSHALGDEYALAVIERRVSYEEARRTQQRVEDQVDAERRRQTFNANRRRF